METKRELIPAFTILLLGIIYLAFISLGLPDSVLGVAIPPMQIEWGMPLWAGGVASGFLSFRLSIRRIIRIEIPTSHAGAAGLLMPLPKAAAGAAFLPTERKTRKILVQENRKFGPVQLERGTLKIRDFVLH